MIGEAAVRKHIDAFNAHDRERLLAGLTPECSWSTGVDTVLGRLALAELFDDGLWAMEPHLTVTRLIAAEETVAVECVEHITIAGARESFTIAGFYDMDDSGLISRVKIFREGTADLSPGQSFRA